MPTTRTKQRTRAGRRAGTMADIPGGTFRMGAEGHYPEEAPVHPVTVAGFRIDRYAVTNAEFARFVRQTGHRTVAEQPSDPTDYPGADAASLVPASVVFAAPDRPVPLTDPYRWWHYVPGADWRHPRGPGSAAQDDHPVVHLAWADVEAYAAWAGKQVPTEAEWEYAARGGLDGATYAWGEEFTPGGRHLANTWQGSFPYLNTVTDGFPFTAPVGSFPPNGYGLYDMIGNVWEWTADWYADHSAEPVHACCGRERSIEPGGLPIPRKVMKGGSHLCAPNYCRRYRPAARMPQAVDTATSHLGFRLVQRG
jgi:sulfatase modifying factor 1